MLLPSKRTATPQNKLNRAFDPTPSTFPVNAPHLPASVDTLPP